MNQLAINYASVAVEIVVSRVQDHVDYGDAKVVAVRTIYQLPKVTIFIFSWFGRSLW
jgi:hypothetical protein